MGNIRQGGGGGGIDCQRDQESYLKIWPPGDSDNNWKYIQPAFIAILRMFVEQSSEWRNGFLIDITPESVLKKHTA